MGEGRPGRGLLSPLKHSVHLQALSEPTLLPRVVRILYWQGVEPALLHWTATGDGMVQVRLAVDCDPWRLRRLVVHWQRIKGMQAVTTEPPGPGPAVGPEEHVAPAAR